MLSKNSKCYPVYDISVFTSCSGEKSQFMIWYINNLQQKSITYTLIFYSSWSKEWKK